MIIDTHCHYGLHIYEGTLEAEAERCRAAGVEQVICSPITFEQNLTIAEDTAAFPGRRITLGIHPEKVPRLCEAGRKESGSVREALLRRQKETEILEQFSGQMRTLRDLAVTHKEIAAAIGETGIDVHKPEDEANLEMQRISLFEHLRLSLDLKLPLVLHLRGEGAAREALAIMRRHCFETSAFRGTVHCWQGDPEDLRSFAENPRWDFVFGIGGVLTYPERGRRLRETLRAAAAADREGILRRLVLETDAPFLVPEEMKAEAGDLNSSAYLPCIMRTLADLLEVPEEEICARTTENALRIFG